MAKTLELYFLTSSGKTARLSVMDPKEPVNVEEVKTAMEQIIQADIFETMHGSFAGIKEAHLIDRQVEKYEFS